MPVVIFILALFVLYIAAKILIPVLLAILTLFALLAAIAPFVLYAVIGFFIGRFIERDERFARWRKRR
jgi:hypothetical protein